MLMKQFDYFVKKSTALIKAIKLISNWSKSVDFLQQYETWKDKQLNRWQNEVNRALGHLCAHIG